MGITFTKRFEINLKLFVEQTQLTMRTCKWVNHVQNWKWNWISLFSVLCFHFRHNLVLMKLKYALVSDSVWWAVSGERWAVNGEQWTEIMALRIIESISSFKIDNWSLYMTHSTLNGPCVHPFLIFETHFELTFKMNLKKQTLQ